MKRDEIILGGRTDRTEKYSFDEFVERYTNFLKNINYGKRK